jgi:putative transposase
MIREYENGSFYHVFNRGVEKRAIFLDERDYKVFLYYLKVFLTPLDLLDKDEPFHYKFRRNYADSVKLVCFCLMPNHFHLMLQQLEDNGVADFMRSLSNAYTRYFNERYQRVGSLFQGRFKASRIQSESYYLYISHYIHSNPLALKARPQDYKYSSVRQFIDENAAALNWLDPAPALEPIGNRKAYQKFLLEDQPQVPKDLIPIAG